MIELMMHPPTYTKRELIILLEDPLMSDCLNLFPIAIYSSNKFSIKRYIEKRIKENKKAHYRHNHKYPPDRRWNKIYKLLYETPLEKTPLMVNHGKPYARAIAKWRLYIGK